MPFVVYFNHVVIVSHHVREYSKVENYKRSSKLAKTKAPPFILRGIPVSPSKFNRFGNYPVQSSKL